MTQRRHLTFWPAVGMLLCFILLQILISAGMHDFGMADYRYGDPRDSVIQVIAYGLLFSTLMHLCSFGYRDLFGPISLADVSRRSLWPSILAHMTHNAAALTIWPVEGIATGSNPLLSTVSLFVSVAGLRLLSARLPKAAG